MCTAAGVEAKVAVAGMGEGLFQAIDIAGDGTAEIVQGGTTVQQVISELVVLVSGRLARVDDVLLVSGPTDFADDNFRTVDSWGCEDIDDDGRPELVLAAARRAATGVTLTKTGYRLVGSTASEVAVEAQQLPVFPELGDQLMQSDTVGARAPRASS